MPKEMKKPKMILFDYGQTLINEKGFNSLEGTKAVMKYAIVNKHGYSCEAVNKFASEIKASSGRYNSEMRYSDEIELPNRMFMAYLYESLGIKLSINLTDVERVFWNAASPGCATEGIEEFLSYLKSENIRTGVISNISISPELVKERINILLPENDFEFIITSSEYMFRKPNRRIFDLALEKADLPSCEVWYVGDNYKCDILGAKSAGMFPVMYIGASVKKETYGDIITVSSWNELKERISHDEKDQSCNYGS